MDLLEKIIDHLSGTAGFESVHVGQVIPDHVNFPYVFLSRAGETAEETLDHELTPDVISIDCEVVSDSIPQQQSITNLVKTTLRAVTAHQLTFVNDAGANQTIHGFDVDNHDDDYVLKSVDSDERDFVGALDITVSLGALV